MFCFFLFGGLRISGWFSLVASERQQDQGSSLPLLRSPVQADANEYIAVVPHLAVHSESFC